MSSTHASRISDLMRYSELKIETQRQAPARARSEGSALLRRAGYIRNDGEITPLGRRAYVRLEELSQAHAANEFFFLLELPTVKAREGSYYFAVATGSEEVLQCSICGYASLRELAQFRKQPTVAEKPIPLEKVLTPECNTIEALASFLGVPQEKTAKALMYTRTADNQFVFAVVRGDMQMSERKLKEQVGAVRQATVDEIIASGAAPGYASPIGLMNTLVVVDDLIPASANLVAGANEPGYHLKNTNYARDYTAQLVTDLALAEPGAACPECGNSLSLLPADLLSDATGHRLGTVLEALAETHHDEKGLTLPATAAPFSVYLLHLPGKELDTRRQAQELHDAWERAGVPVLYDDRDVRAGVKFTDADLIGCPIRATVGERGMKDGMVELKRRSQSEINLLPFDTALPTIQSLIEKIP